MIIGVMGKIGSGKDYCGKIVQYLISESITRSGHYKGLDLLPNDPDNWTLDKFINVSGWHIKKYASKLKQIASILTGIPEADFEEEEVKDSILGKRWDYICVRKFLQKLGTDAIRNNIHPNAWVNALMSEYNSRHHSVNYGFTTDGGCIPIRTNNIYPNWVVTDVRFPNEVQAIKDRGGIMIRMVKLGDDGAPLLYSDQHPSETALDSYEPDYTVSAKHGDIDSLITQIKDILVKEKIIK